MSGLADIHLCMLILENISDPVLLVTLLAFVITYYVTTKRLVSLMNHPISPGQKGRNNIRQGSKILQQTIRMSACNLVDAVVRAFS